MPRAKLISDELLELRQLVRGSDSIELKVTVPDQLPALGEQGPRDRPVEAQIRQVFFFDTPDLALNQAGVVVRARRIQGRDHDSVIKLRPVVPDELPADLRADPELRHRGRRAARRLRVLGLAEGDAGTGRHPQVGARRPAAAQAVQQDAAGVLRRPRPRGIELDDLAVLGPIFVLKVKVTPARLGQRLVGEMWLYPDGSRIVELSTKCLPGQGIGRRDRRARLPRRPGPRPPTATSRPRPRRRSSSSRTSSGRRPELRATRSLARGLARLTQPGGSRRRPSGRRPGRSCGRCAGRGRAA